MSARVAALVEGYRATCILVAASRLGVFERLETSSPKAESVLARELGALDVGRLHRLLRALVVLDLVTVDDAGVRLTADGALLKSGVSGLAAVPVMIGEQYLRAWSELDVSVRTGEPAFDRIFGKSAWQHRRETPAVNDAFNRMIAGVQESAAPTILDAVDLGHATKIVDVGGGNGHLLASVGARWPAPRGVLFDQPHVVELGERLFAERGLAERFSVAGGSFFEDGVPRGGDVYVLQHILHDWDDPTSVAILSNVRKAMTPGARLLVLECVVDERDLDPGLVMRDLHMMAVLGGTERSLADFDGLFAQSGFRRTRYVATPPHAADVIEAEAL